MQKIETQEHITVKNSNQAIKRQSQSPQTQSPQTQFASQPFSATQSLQNPQNLQQQKFQSNFHYVT